MCSGRLGRGDVWESGGGGGGGDGWRTPGGSGCATHLGAALSACWSVVERFSAFLWFAQTKGVHWAFLLSGRHGDCVGDVPGNVEREISIIG